jgi:hypothetical protein
MRGFRQSRQDFGQVRRTQLPGSTRGLDLLGQPDARALIAAADLGGNAHGARV